MPYVPPGPSGMPQGWDDPAAPAASDTSMDVEPGAWIQLQEEDLALQKYMADLQHQIAMLQVKIGQEANALQKQQLMWQMRQAQDDLKFRREQLAEQRKTTELKLATSPIDFVAYEMYKRYLQGQAEKGEPAASPSEVAPQIEDAIGLGVQPGPPSLGGQRPGERGAYGVEGMRETWPGTFTGGPLDEDAGLPLAPSAPAVPAFEGPFGTPRTDEEIQAMIDEMVGTGGGALGTGAFGTDVPMTQAISRQEGQALSQDEMAVLSSFLRAGFTPSGGGQKVSYDPTDYWREVEEGWIPTIKTPAATQYSF